MPKVAVTGCNGFIASWIACYLLEQDYEVVACVRGADLTKEKNQKKLKHLTSLPGAKERMEFKELDMIKSTKEDFIEAFKGCNYVIHTASVIIFKKVKSKAEEDKVLAPAIEGTDKVMHACYDINKNKLGDGVKIERVIYTSSIGAVTSIFDGGSMPEGKKKGDEITFTGEDFVDATDDKINTYSKSKVKAEVAAWDFVNGLADDDEAKFDFATIIPPLVAGPSLSHKRPAVAETFTIPFNSKFLIGVPKIKFWVVDCRDVALAHIKAIQEDNVHGNRFLVGAKYTFLHDMYKTAKEHYKPFGYSVVSGTIPGALVKIYSIFNSTVKATVALIGQKVIMDTKPAKDILKMEYRALEETIIDSCDSLIYYGYIKSKKPFKNYQWEPNKILDSKTEATSDENQVAVAANSEVAEAKE
jgi:nucleoside-diphosphate-sugar epimerase